MSPTKPNPAPVAWHERRWFACAAAISFLLLIAWFLISKTQIIFTRTNWEWQTLFRSYPPNDPFIAFLNRYRSLGIVLFQILPLLWLWKNSRNILTYLNHKLDTGPQDPDHCRKCGYKAENLKRCPECGTRHYRSARKLNE